MATVLWEGRNAFIKTYCERVCVGHCNKKNSKTYQLGNICKKKPTPISTLNFLSDLEKMEM